jgi:hypothetical protein
MATLHSWLLAQMGRGGTMAHPIFCNCYSHQKAHVHGYKPASWQHAHLFSAADCCETTEWGPRPLTGHHGSSHTHHKTEGNTPTLRGRQYQHIACHDTGVPPLSYARPRPRLVNSDPPLSSYAHYLILVETLPHTGSYCSSLFTIKGF